MDSSFGIYKGDDIPLEDKARLDGFLFAKTEMKEIDEELRERLIKELMEEQAKVD